MNVGYQFGRVIADLVTPLDRWRRPTQEFAGAAPIVRSQEIPASSGAQLDPIRTPPAILKADDTILDPTTPSGGLASTRRFFRSYLGTFLISLGAIVTLFATISAFLEPLSDLMRRGAPVLLFGGEDAKFMLPALAAIVIALQLAVRSHGDISVKDARARAWLLSIAAGITSGVSSVIASVAAANVWIASDTNPNKAQYPLAIGIAFIGFLIAIVGADAMTAAHYRRDPLTVPV